MENSETMIPEDSPYTTIHLDSSGDLKLLVKDADQQSKTLIVCSNAMCLASPVWRTMLDPKSHFKESKEKAIELPEDDLDALLIILRIAHLKFRQLPKAVSFTGLVNLAVVCDKYDTVGIVRNFFPVWLAPWEKVKYTPGYEEWLSIAWTIGDFGTFQELCKHLVASCHIDSAGRMCRSGKPLTISVVPFVLDKIFEARKDLVTKLLKVCSKLMARYRTEETLSCSYVSRNGLDSDIAKECDTIVYGSLIRGLDKIGIAPFAVTSSNICMSATELMTQLQEIRCYTLNNGPRRELLHENCGFTEVLNTKIEGIKELIMPSVNDVVLDDSFREHMKEQAEK